jgi:hypothetical protein
MKHQLAYSSEINDKFLTLARRHIPEYLLSLCCQNLEFLNVHTLQNKRH